jgi:hypothetical protein
MFKYFKPGFLATVIILGVFVFGNLVSVTPVKAQTMTLSQLVEMLITIGAITPDKVASARAMVTTLNNTQTVSTTTIATSTSYVQVLSPNGGESWEIDLDIPYTIKWGSVGITKANVSLVTSKNTLCDLGPLPVSSKNGNHEFKILLKTAKCYDNKTGSSTPLVDGSYKVRVYYTDSVGNTIKDESNATFKITPVPVPSLKVTYPNGTETLIRNDEYVVRYTAKNIDDTDNDLIYLYLLDNNGNVAFNSHKLFRKDGTYELDLPSSLSVGAYKIKLKLTTDEHVELEDTSDNFFWVSSKN